MILTATSLWKLKIVEFFKNQKGSNKKELTFQKKLYEQLNGSFEQSIQELHGTCKIFQWLLKRIGRMVIRPMEFVEELLQRQLDCVRLLVQHWQHSEFVLGDVGFAEAVVAEVAVPNAIDDDDVILDADVA